MKRALRFLGLAALCSVGLSALAEVREAGTLDELTSAISAANEGDTVRITAAIEGAVTVDKAITLDFNGNAVTGQIDVKSAGVVLADAAATGGVNGNVNLKAGAEVTVRGGRYVGANKNYSGVFNVKAATLTIEEGTEVVAGQSGNWDWGVYLTSSSTTRAKLVVNGGHFSNASLYHGDMISTTADVPSVNVCEVVINGGTFDCAGIQDHIVSVNSSYGAKIEINDGTFNFNYSKSFGSTYYSGGQYVFGGTFPSSGVAHDSSKAVINGGTFNFNAPLPDGATWCGWGQLYTAYSYNTAEWLGMIVVNGGTFNRLNKRQNFGGEIGLVKMLSPKAQYEFDSTTGNCVVWTPIANWEEAVTAQPAEFVIDESAKTISISSEKALAWFGKTLNQKANYGGYTITIDGDLDMGAYPWLPINADYRDGIGTGNLAGATIKGVNGAVIRNLKINTCCDERAPDNRYYAGFIGQESAKDLVIRDIDFIGADVNVDCCNGVAVVVGWGYHEMTFDNVGVYDSKVRGESKAGLLLGGTAGDGRLFTITNCAAAGSTVTAGYAHALIVGYLNSSANDRVNLADCRVKKDCKAVTEPISYWQGNFTYEFDGYTYGYAKYGSQAFLVDPCNAWYAWRTGNGQHEVEGVTYTFTADTFFRPKSTDGEWYSSEADLEHPEVAVVVNEEAVEEKTVVEGATTPAGQEAAKAAVQKAANEIANNTSVVQTFDTGVKDKDIILTPADEVKPAIQAGFVAAIEEGDLTPAQKVEAAQKLADKELGREVRVEFNGVGVKVLENEEEQPAAQVKTVTYEVLPKAVILVAAEGGKEKKVEIDLTNDMIEGKSLAFTMPVPDSFTKNAEILHKGDGDKYEDEVLFRPVKGLAGGRYVELAFTHFCEVTINDYQAALPVEVVGEETLAIVKLGAPAAAGTELAGGSSFADEKISAMVVTGRQNDDKVLTQDDAGALVEADFESSISAGTAFWYKSAAASSVPVAIAGLKAASVSTTVAGGTTAAPMATLLVNPYNTASDLLAAMSGTPAEGDQIALAGDNVRYVYAGGKWGCYEKFRSVAVEDIYTADVFKQATSIAVDGGKAAWYVSKGGTPTVAWPEAGNASESAQVAAADAATYAALDWNVTLGPAEIDSFPHKAVRLVAYDADGNKVGRYGRQTGGDFSATNTVFLGAGGFAGAASFAVELLDENYNVIAISEKVSVGDLGTALSATYAGGVVPATATTSLQFTGFSAGDVFEYLQGVIAGNGYVKSEADGFVVVLTNNIAGTVTLADNLGNVTIDLNGRKIVNETVGGNAIVVKADETFESEGVTALAIKNGSGTDAGLVKGGDGASGMEPVAGGAAILVQSDKGVTVAVKKPNGQGVAPMIVGGNGGTGVRVPAAAAGEAVSGATLTGDIELAKAGEPGFDAAEPWAWCVATVPDGSTLPEGVTLVDGKYLFWKRTGGEETPALFDFGAVKAWTIEDDTIHFCAGNIKVKNLNVPSDYGKTIRFVGADGETGTTLMTADAAGVFTVGESSEVRSWTRIGFTSGDAAAHAIDMTGGQLEVADCFFGGLVAYDYGTAICAKSLTANSIVTNTTFESNAADGANGYGGAIYASAKTEGLKLTVVDSAFEGNRAGAEGGAIFTIPGDAADAKAIALAITDTEFRDNAAPFGGAISAEGGISLDGKDSVFEGNFAQEGGGAISVRNGNSSAEDPVIAFAIGRGVRFVGNVVSNDTTTLPAIGGAIEVSNTNCEFSATGVLFKGNRAVARGEIVEVDGEDGAEYWEYGSVIGGALSFVGGTAAIDTCVFDDNDAVALAGNTNGYGFACYGGAIDFDGTVAGVTNVTIRYSNVDAVTAYGGSLDLLNCVVVGNGEAAEYFMDVYASDADLTVNRSAYTAIEPDASTDANYNLANRTTAIYDGDSLKLNPVGFNPVAVFGYVQPGARDFEGVAYGIDDCWSMGAYEAVTVRLTVTVTGDKDYDGTTTTNGIEQFVFALSTNGVPVAAADVCPDLGEVTELFTVTNWTFEAAHVGYYASTNAAGARITASMSGLEDFRDAFAFVYTGTIGPAADGLEIVIEPLEYEWTGDEVIPTSVKVYDRFTHVELTEGVDYELAVFDNVDPTASAKVRADGLYNFKGASSTSNFWITAYYVTHSFDGKVRDEYTEEYGALSGSNAVAQALAEADVPAGYCFDSQNCVTNGAVRKFDAEGGLLTIDVKYYTDQNGDKVPDIYQQQVLAKVANGKWSEPVDFNDKIVWVTLTNGVSKWATKADGGSGKLAGVVPTAGEHAFDDFAEGGWFAFVGGHLTLVGDKAALEAQTVGADGTLTAPFFFYGYRHAPQQTTGRGGRGGRGGTGGTTTVATVDLAEQYGATMSLTSAEMVDNVFLIGTRIALKDLVTGAEMGEIPTANGKALLLTAPSPTGPWAEIEVDVDAKGNAAVPAEAERAAFFKGGDL